MGKPKAVIFRASKKYFPINNYHVYFDKIDKLFEEYFDVCVSSDEGCDYENIITKKNADLAIFQFNAFRINDVKNVENNNSIPKIGLGIIDSSDFKRGIYYRLLEELGVSHFFFTGPIIGGTLPNLKDKIFYLPHFIDSDINKDYGLEKNIPILITGNHEDQFYSWRAKVREPILNYFPALWFRHPGYDPNRSIPEALRIQGKAYFKTINASYISSTCGSIKRSLIMKHLEIPGSRACLVCEENETVKLHGFKSNENCVFATPKNIVEKIQYLFENPDELKRITDNGYEFVHNNHTYKHRPQILQLYELLKKKKPGQKIIQPSLLGDLELVDDSDPKETIHIQVSDEIEWIKQIDRDIINKNYVRAEQECKRIIDIAEYIHDAKMRLYLIHMLNKRKKYASLVLKDLIKPSTNYPVIIDPIDHTLLIVHLLALKKLSDALQVARMGIYTRRVETDMARLLAFKISGKKEYSRFLRDAISKSLDRNEIKTIYYFYTKEFNFLKILETIVKRNIKYQAAKNFRFSASMNQNESNEVYSKLNEVKVDYDSEFIKELLIELDTDIPSGERMIRKVQDSYYQLKHLFHNG